MLKDRKTKIKSLSCQFIGGCRCDLSTHRKRTAITISLLAEAPTESHAWSTALCAVKIEHLWEGKKKQRDCKDSLELKPLAAALAQTDSHGGRCCRRSRVCWGIRLHAAPKCCLYIIQQFGHGSGVCLWFLSRWLSRLIQNACHAGTWPAVDPPSSWAAAEE